MSSFKISRSRTLGSLMVSLILLAAIVLAMTASPGSAQTPQDPSGPTPSGGLSAGQGLTKSRQIEAFLNETLARQLGDYEIPGATVSVVNDERILVAEGYGQADVEADEPVSAEKTLFKVASVSKLFTATAVMQLAEEGKVDLDEDVNAYLDNVRVPDTYPGEPITMRHLLTHTAGFEERFTGSGARDAADLGLEEYLSEHMPARVRPPGEVMAYSNYGMALAGHVVEEVSGVPFGRYVEENVFAPLAMESTTFAQPPSSELEGGLATGYDIEEGEPVAGEFLGYPRDAPAASAITTATDMAAFMIAHLQDGRYGEARILEEATAQEMHARQFAGDPRLDGVAYGFEEQTLNGERAIVHGGDQLQYHALAALLPERNAGIFVAYNSTGNGGDYAEYELVEAFIDRFYPEPGSSATETRGNVASGNAERVAGSYRPTRSNLTGFEKFMTLPNSSNVTANEDGSITTSGVPSRKDLDGGEQRWVEVAPLLFQAEGGDEHITFRQDSEGNVQYLFGEASPPNVVYEKLSSYESPGLHLGMLAGGLAVFLLTAVAWPVGATIPLLFGRRRRKLYGKPGDPHPEAGKARRARVLAWSASVVNLVFAIGMVAVISSVTATAYGASPLLIAVLTLPLLGAVVTVGVLVEATLSWRRGYWGMFGRMHYSAIALSAVTFAALLAYYNLNLSGL
jgi:CubicO group peptidase (beta-lactamase class C family)